MIKERVDLSRVDCRLAVTDSPFGALPWMIKCKQHADSTASCAVYQDHLHCFGCGFHIKRRIETLAYLLGFFRCVGFGGGIIGLDTLDINKAVSVAHKYTVESLDRYRERVSLEARRDPLPESLAACYNKLLLGSRRDRCTYLHKRGLTNIAVDVFCLGHDGTRFVIPFFDAKNQLVTFRFRQDEEYGLVGEERRDGSLIPKYSGYPGRNASGAYLYPEWLVARQEEDFVVAVESELCAIRLRQEGIPAAATFSGAGAMKHLPRLLKPFEKIKEMYVAVDMDEAGEGGYKDLLQAASEHELFVKWIVWNRDWGKDPTELYQNGHKLVKENEKWVVK